MSATVYYETDPGGRLLALTDGTAVYYYGLDGHGSVVNLTNGAGAVVDSYRYDPYGNGLGKLETGSLANPWQYAGGYLDRESGLYLFGVRYYAPKLGRFLQQDPLGSADDSQYAYAGSNPCNNSDPSGMQTCYHFTSSKQAKEVYNGLNDEQRDDSKELSTISAIPGLSLLAAIFLSWLADKIADINHAMNWISEDAGDGFYVTYEVNGLYNYHDGTKCDRGDHTFAYAGNHSLAQSDDNSVILEVENPIAWERSQNGGNIPG